MLFFCSLFLGLVYSSGRGSQKFEGFAKRGGLDRFLEHHFLCSFFSFFQFFFLLDHSPFQLWLASQPAGCLVPAIKGLLFLSRYTITLHCRGAARREKREGRVGGERGVNGQWAMGDGLGREVGRQGLIGGAKGKEGQHALCGMSTVYSIYRRRYNHHHGWACNYPLGLACEDRIRSGRV